MQSYSKLIVCMFIRSWKNLENKMSDKRTQVLNAWEELQTILGLIEAETKWQKRLIVTVEDHNKQNLIEHRSLPGLISNLDVSVSFYFIIV